MTPTSALPLDPDPAACAMLRAVVALPRRADGR